MRNPNCNLCERNKSSPNNICIWGNAPTNSTKEIMIVVDSISPSTYQTSLLSSGQGGKILIDLLNSIGILEKCYVTSAVKCYSEKKPLANEWKVCRHYLKKEVENIKPKLIICLGTIAVAAIFNKQYTLKALRQRYFEYPDDKDIKVAATYSHNIYFVEPSKYNSLVQDVHWIMNNFNRVDDKFDYKLQVNKPFEYSKVLGFDIETTGLNVFTDKLLTLAVASPNNKTATGLNVSHPQAPLPDDAIINDLHNHFNDFANEGTIFIGHNIKFDIKKFELSTGNKHKCKLWDTGIMHAMINENSTDNDLKTLASMYTNMGHYEDELDVTNLINEPFEKVIQYNMLDSIVPLKLTEIFYPELQRQGLVNIFNFISEMLSIFVEIEQTGVQLDLEKANEIKTINTEIVDTIRTKYFQFNINSDDQIAILLEKLNCPSLVMTKGGQRSTSKDTLNELLSLEILSVQAKEFISDILVYRDSSSILRHIDEMMRFSYNGKVFTTYNLAKAIDAEGKQRGTVTGRLSGSKANLQNKPPEVRPIFTKDKEYKYFVTADYSQIELRVAAFLSREPNFINAFNSNKDVHTSVLCDIFDYKYEEMDKLLLEVKEFENNKQVLFKYQQNIKDQRHAIKRVNFGILYKIGTKHLVKVIRTELKSSMSENDVKNIIDKWYEQNAVLIKWIKHTEDQIIKDGYYRTIFGRIRHLPGATRKTDMGNRLLRQGINYPIQSAASDICLLGIYNLHDTFTNSFINLGGKDACRLLMTVHDEISFETKCDSKEYIQTIVNHSMIRNVLKEMKDRFNINFDIPLDISVTIGDRWSK